MINFLRAAVFPLSTKNLRGADIRPPPSVRGLIMRSSVRPVRLKVSFNMFRGISLSALADLFGIENKTCLN